MPHHLARFATILLTSPTPAGVPCAGCGLPENGSFVTQALQFGLLFGCPAPRLSPHSYFFLSSLHVRGQALPLLTPTFYPPLLVPCPGLAAVSGISPSSPLRSISESLTLGWGGLDMAPSPGPCSLPQPGHRALGCRVTLQWTVHPCSLDLSCPGCHHPGLPHSRQEPLMFCAIEAMSLVIC